MFRVTPRLLDCRITLFTRVNCSLCDTAKAVVGNVQKATPFTYREINVMEPGQEKWKDVYEFDTPVVGRLRCTRSTPYSILQQALNHQIHVDKTDSTATTTSARKLMHRFREGEVTKLIDEVERS